MLKRLRFKLVLTNMAIVTLMLCIIFGLVLYFTRANLANESITMMEDLAKNPYQLGLPDQTEDNVRLPYFIIQITPFGELVAAGGGYYDLSDAEFLQQLANIAYGKTASVGVLPDYNLRFLRQTTLTGQIIVFADMSSEISTMHSLIRSCLAVGGLSFLVFLGISLLLAQWMVRPVAAAWSQQRQFVADASHELKTPLTVITTNAELLQEPTADETSRRRYADAILTMSRQMRELVEQLLELARADSGQVRTVMEPLDLSRLIGDAVLPFEPVYFEKGLTLESAVEPGICLTGSTQELRELADILLDNARKYSAPGTVALRLSRSGKNRCILSVENPGKPITGEDRLNIFKRFYRIDASRGEVSGHGLGLSIAEEITARHHGRIYCESEGGLNRFIVSLPCATRSVQTGIADKKFSPEQKNT